MNLKIVKYPSKGLREVAKPVTFPLKPELKKLASDMVETVRKASGIGLAAPQVAHNSRIIIVDLETMGLPPFALFNPEIVSASKKTEGAEEGCLSIPGVFGIVERPVKVKFKGQDHQGNVISTEVDGMLARVIQHEIDHIDGILIIDKISKFTQGKELLEKMESKK
jgi:peptide deformylase